MEGHTASAATLYWWLDSSNNRNGPIQLAELRSLHKQKLLSDQTYCWTQGWSEWLPYHQIHADGGGEKEKEPPNGEYSFTDDDGTQYQWDGIKGSYAPVSASAGGYSMEQQTMVNEEQTMVNEEHNVNKRQKTSAAPAPVSGKNVRGDKSVDETKVEAALERERERQRELEEKEAQRGWFELSKNTSVYVKGLPTDAVEEEIQEHFQKCGIIKLDDNNRPKIKIYTDKETGTLKGDGLVTYLKPPSVDLACQILDGAHFRPGSHVLSVTPAKFEMKGDTYVKRKRKAKPKGKGKKNASVVAKQEDESLHWGGFDDIHKTKDVTVILKNMFDPLELENQGIDVGKHLKELHKDLVEECKAKCGEVWKARTYKHNPEGVVSVTFNLPQAAAKCVSIMDGRWFDGRQLSADLYDGYTNYHTKKRKETAEEEQRRLEKFSEDLEQ